MPYEDIGFIACFILLIPFSVNNYFFWKFFILELRNINREIEDMCELFCNFAPWYVQGVPFVKYAQSGAGKGMFKQKASGVVPAHMWIIIDSVYNETT